MPKGSGPKINYGTPTVFEIHKFQKPFWACLGMPGCAHLKLHDQFVALIDVKLHAQNQLYTSINFWDIKVLKVSLRMPDHTHFNLQSTSLLSFTAHIYHVMIIMTGGFSKKSFFINVIFISYKLFWTILNLFSWNLNTFTNNKSVLLLSVHFVLFF